jgi:hypothetical protein
MFDLLMNILTALCKRVYEITSILYSGDRKKQSYPRNRPWRLIGL